MSEGIVEEVGEFPFILAAVSSKARLRHQQHCAWLISLRQSPASMRLWSKPLSIYLSHSHRPPARRTCLPPFNLFLQWCLEAIGCLFFSSSVYFLAKVVVTSAICDGSSSFCDFSLSRCTHVTSTRPWHCRLLVSHSHIVTFSQE